MSIDRRESGQSRRRRVLYQTTRDSTPETAAERRSAERLREARRPTASYGSHVNRRLRGRWFSLVPVSRTAMSICGILVFGSALLLTLLHFAAVSWLPLASNEELARPFRLDRSDSFGSWARAFFLAAGSATALLIYQLRRYKVDDYTGSYRIWRSVIVLVAILSVDSICHLVPWLGAMIDAGFGKRMALSGADWIRIVLTVGGGALALRLVAEVRRSKLALAMTLVALVAFAIPLLSHWKLIDTSQMRGWMLWTSSPLIASAALWISFGGYLRMLFREVRGFDAERAAMKQEMVEARKSAKIKTEEPETPRGWFRRRAETSAEKTLLKPTKSRLATPSTTSLAQPEAKEPLKREPSTETKRSWFAFAKSKKRVDATEPTNVQKPKIVPAKPVEATKPVVVEKSVVAATPVRKLKPTALKQETEAPAKRSWFSFGRNKSVDANLVGVPQVSAPAKPVTVATKTSPAILESRIEPEKPARKGLGSWLRRDSAVKDDIPEAKSKIPADTRPVTASLSTDAEDDDDDDVSDDSVDWGSMNKSERRRMRKEMKRSGRAA